MAEEEGADWREVVSVIFGLDPAREPDRAKVVHDSHLARARWMSESRISAAFATADAVNRAQSRKLRSHVMQPQGLVCRADFPDRDVSLNKQKAEMTRHAHPVLALAGDHRSPQSP
ncbi:hypothetical protein ACVWZV_000886 [Bradyrhizobium sp. GM5.1]